MPLRIFLPILLIVCSLTTQAAQPAVPAAIDFNRDVRPILSDNCFACHGPDASKREAELRLDLRDDAIKQKAIVPGKAEESLLVKHIFSKDPEELMPPPASNKKLTEQQKAILKKWIAEGAEYKRHWSYEKPVKAAIPANQNAIDVLVAKRLAEIGLKASPEADRRTLIRRLYSDLLGLPPTPQEVAEFVNDKSPDAYAKLVERVLANPHYGERMAIAWLDVVRYADTIGYHSDTPRNVWPFRDWVIKSFNDNKPFDRFTLEQVAGDLLPDANQETQIGSAFNRLLLSTEEGGAQPKDYEARMLTDRVRAIGAAWLGQTTGCAQCHDHKFDPFTARDFYQLGAFFADIKEPILGKREEGLVLKTPEDDQKLAQLDAELAEATKKHKESLPQIDAAQKEWEEAVVKDEQKLAALKKEAKPIADHLEKEPKERKPNEVVTIQTHFRTKVSKEFAATNAVILKADQARKEYFNGLAKCLVSIRNDKPRTVRILPRGDWMNDKGEVVKPALPHYLPQTGYEGRELTRLDLAKWLVARENPLPSRTVMNRLWKQFFGNGLSKVLDDLGAQGEPPLNPALLDWLACEFIDSGWDTKHMVRQIVNSATYKQVSIASPELLAADPYNREYARQSAYRVDAELVRDAALSFSGLLSTKIGGPSVKPYQPDGYWENLNFPVRSYVADKNESQYRRGLYTWWQRSFLHPSMLAFDAPSREECAAERNRSNIPQQALVLLNDPTYVEAARVFAARILSQGGDTADKRIAWAWQQVLQREPTADELLIARPLLDKHLAVYRQDAAAAAALLKTGLAPTPTNLDSAELAAWTHLARVLLNLHETITRS